jgi:membrane-associated phospholipid phosphatase
VLDQHGWALVTAHLCGREFALAALLLVFLLAPSSVCGQETAFGPLRGPSLWDDLRYLGNTVWEDGKTIALAPLEIGKVREVTTEQLLLTALVVGSVGGMIGLDSKIRDAAKGIDDRSALTLQRVGFGLVGSGLVALYGTGWWTDDEQKRHAALTGLESTGVAYGVAQLMKVTFGRERPDSGKGPLAWFQGGQSFISADATPAFALAEAVAAGFDHRWEVTVPAYLAATAVGVGRMGRDRHWASDILASAFVGSGTTMLFNYMHRRREQAAPQLSVSPVLTPHEFGLCVNVVY